MPFLEEPSASSFREDISAAHDAEWEVVSEVLHLKGELGLEGLKAFVECLPAQEGTT
ncbi:MAG: hypothetical protein U5L95_01320 [Candidatus Saccharibacteria bacterium]|nr:hypothetical protein [Candidatus Saccharibacteria bacterium]